MEYKKKDVSGSRASIPSRKKSADPLPKIEPLQGAVCAQMVRCGKAGCKCERGEMHGPFHYLFWREGGKLRKVYIRKEDVERVSDLCRAKRRSRQMINRKFELWRILRLAIKEVESNVRTNRA
jgi:hypothetical protein